MHNLSCKQCGGRFECDHKREYCTAQCIRRHRQARKKMHTHPLKPIECAGCGKRMLPVKSGHKFCDDNCRQIKRRRDRGQQPRVAAAKRGPLSVVYCRDACGVCSRPYIAKHFAARFCRRCVDFYGASDCSRISSGRLNAKCYVCGAAFSRLPKKGIRACSDVCTAEGNAILRRKNKSKRRKAIRGGETFDPFEIFNRDNWRCRQCGKPTPKRIRGKGLNNSPELDHIVPISKGGEHTRSNTQCLCRACNIKKGDTTAGAQPFLL